MDRKNIPKKQIADRCFMIFLKINHGLQIQVIKATKWRIACTVLE